MVQTSTRLAGLIRPEVAAIEQAGSSSLRLWTPPAGPDPALGRRRRSADPGFHRRRRQASLDRGETFYTYQRGIPELRDTIAPYMSAHYGAASAPERFFVTVGGMHALDIAVK